MAMRQQANRWRTDTLIELDTLLSAAVLDPDITPREQAALAVAGEDLLNGWKKIVVTFSSSNKGYEFDDLPVKEIQILKSAENAIKLLHRLAAS